MNMEPAKHGVDAVAALSAIGAVVGWLPSIAAALTIVWYGIRIYEWWRGRK